MEQNSLLPAEIYWQVFHSDQYRLKKIDILEILKSNPYAYTNGR
jgi:hypothetical protein